MPGPLLPGAEGQWVYLAELAGCARHREQLLQRGKR